MGTQKQVYYYYCYKYMDITFGSSSISPTLQHSLS